MIASSSIVSTVECESLGPVGRSLTAVRYLAWRRSSGLCHSASPEPSDSLKYAVSFDGPPLSLWLTFRTCPIAHPFSPQMMHHRMPGSNIQRWPEAHEPP